MRRRLFSALGASALASLVLAASAAAAAPPSLGNSGRWITNPQGQVVITHGVNMVSKIAPYAPSADGFSADDMDFLARNGFNSVRLGVIYKGVEPQPGVYDDAYLSRIAQTQKSLTEHGIFSLLDFHQDLYNERFQGEGWPDWAVQDDGLPAEPKQGFPANYLVMPALNRAFDHFWANAAGPGGVGLQDRYAAAWRHVAGRFERAPGLLGYNILNEPWPGTIYPTCLSNVGCPLFDSNELTSFTKRVFAAIRTADSRHLAWYEPLLTFDFGANTSHGDTGDGRAGFTFHDYCLPGALNVGADAPCPIEEEIPFQNAEAQSARTGDALLLSEFGATKDLPTIKRLVDFSDRYMVSWQYWHYCECGDPTTSGTGIQSVVTNPHMPPSGGNVNYDKLRVLSRPYPRLVSGTPQSWSFDQATRRFELSYSTAKVGSSSRFAGGITEVFVPRVHYKDGYRTSVSGATRVSVRNARILKLRSSAGATAVKLTLNPL